jgi:hypothetical protein
MSHTADASARFSLQAWTEGVLALKEPLPHRLPLPTGFCSLPLLLTEMVVIPRPSSRSVGVIWLFHRSGYCLMVYRSCSGLTLLIQR